MNFIDAIENAQEKISKLTNPFDVCFEALRTACGADVCFEIRRTSWGAYATLDDFKDIVILIDKRNHPLTGNKDSDISLLFKIVKLLVCYLKKKYKTFLLNFYGIILKTSLTHISFSHFLVLEDIC